VFLWQENAHSQSILNEVVFALALIFKLRHYQDGVKMLCESSEDTPFTSKRNTDQRNHLLQSDFWKTLKAVLPIARALCLLQAVCETRNINGGIVACTFWWVRSVVLDQADLTSEEKAALTERVDYRMEEYLCREDSVAWLVDQRLSGVVLNSGQRCKISNVTPTCGKAKRNLALLCILFSRFCRAQRKC